MGGLAVKCAQSRGEWPGSRRTFFEGREEGESVEVEREEIGGARELEGGARSVEAVEGGGRSVVERVGGDRRVDLGFGGEDMRDGSGLHFAFGFGRGGGGIEELGEGADVSKRDDGFDFESDVDFVI